MKKNSSPTKKKEKKKKTIYAENNQLNCVVAKAHVEKCCTGMRKAYTMQWIWVVPTSECCECYWVGERSE